MIIKNGKIITDKILEGKILKTKDTKIDGIYDEKEVDLSKEEIIDAKGNYVSAGFIDLHCHGGNGSDVMDATYENLRNISEYYVKKGTTTLLATTCACSLNELFKVIDAVDETIKKGTTTILGIHLEGPYLNPLQKGCHIEKYLRMPDLLECEKILEKTNNIRHITLAPELPNALDFIKKLKEGGVTISSGHTNAKYEELMKAVELGLSHTTHIYSSMSTVRREGPYRITGVIETTLLEDCLTTEMICDGKHMPGSLMKLIYKCKGADKLCLVTDAMRGAGMPKGDFCTFGSKTEGQTVLIEDGVGMLPDKTAFASSISAFDVMLKNAVNLVNIPFVEAIKMVTLTPAKVLKIDNYKGSLTSGKDADITIFDKNFNVYYTLIKGKIKYIGSLDI